MRAVRLVEAGTLEITDVPDPTAADGEAVIEVHAAAITRGELDWPLDRLPAIPSFEVSGVADGEEVFGLLPFDRDGAAAELAVAPSSVLAPKPASLSHVEAAALPMTGLSAWQGLVEHGRLERGERVRITGPHGGVGHMAVQLARGLGAELVDGDADLLFDTNGDVSGSHGRVVTIAQEAPGATYFVVEPNREQLLELARLADEGVLRPEIDSVYPLGDAEAAFRRVGRRGKRGKVVLQVDQSR